MLKICFIGLGSIGLRHLVNLTKILNERKIYFKIDVLRNKKVDISPDYEKLLDNIYYNNSELSNDYDIIFITNPTYLHYDTIFDSVNKTKHIFIEKPLFDSISYGLEKLNLKQEGIYYVACPLRYHPVIKYMKSIIDDLNIYSIRAISSSYLPDWRKDSDYRNVYSSKKNQGGGVSLDLIHEWDYLTYLFGFPEHVYNIKGKYSNLEIDSDDVSIYIANYKDKLVEIHLDYIGREPVRKCELYCDEYVISIDFINMEVKFAGKTNKVLKLDEEDMYLNEMNYFLDVIFNKTKNINDLNHAFKVLKLAVGEII